jgi:hypothetical protein
MTVNLESVPCRSKRVASSLDTLIWARDALFHLSDLPARPKRPRCGSRRIALLFDIRELKTS